MFYLVLASWGSRPADETTASH